MSAEAIAGHFLENAKEISDTRPNVHDIDGMLLQQNGASVSS